MDLLEDMMEQAKGRGLREQQAVPARGWGQQFFDSFEGHTQAQSRVVEEEQQGSEEAQKQRMQGLRTNWDDFQRRRQSFRWWWEPPRAPHSDGQNF